MWAIGTNTSEAVSVEKAALKQKAPGFNSSDFNSGNTCDVVSRDRQRAAGTTVAVLVDLAAFVI